MAERFTNGAQTTLQVSVNDSLGSITVADASGFPGSGQFRVRVGTELMLVTGVSGTVWAVDRHAEGTTAAAHSAGATVTQVLTAGALQELTTLTAGQPANTVFAGPAAGGAASPGFRALVAADLPSGVVTSVNASGGATGLTFSGGPVTGSGTLTLEGTLAVAGGGTGGTNIAAARSNLGAAAAGAVGSSGLTMAADRLLGRTTAAAGAVEEITVGAGLSLSAGALTSTVTGTVTSVALSGGATGLTVSGSPVTGSGTLTLEGTLAIASGGTGGETAAAARTNLGLEIGTNVQAWDADLSALSALTGTNAIYYRSATNTWSAVTVGTGLSFSGGTLAATGSGGTVTSVNASGGATGLTFSGGPVTGSGTLTLGGTLAIASGGTGSGTAAAARTNLGTPGLADSNTFSNSNAFNGQTTFNNSVAVTAGTLTVPNAGFALLDTNASHALYLTPGSNLTANRTLTLVTGDADRTLTLTGNATISGTNTGDQTIALTGDVTGSGTGSFAASIGANKVTDAMLRQSAGLSVVGRGVNSTGNVADIAAGADGLVLRRSGTSLGFGTVATAGYADNSVTNGKLRDSGPLTVIGNATNSSADPADIAAGSDHQVLRRSGTALAFGAVNLAQGNAVTGLLPLANVDINGATDADPRTATVLAGYDAASTAVGKYSVGKIGGLLRTPPGGRLTLLFGEPVPPGTGAISGGIYYTPYVGDAIRLYDGTRWVTIVFSSTILPLVGLISGHPYDVFGYLNGNALAIEFLAWTNSTTRATGISIQDGYYCKTGDKTRLYLGTFYTTAANQTEDTPAKRYLWNMYNRVPRMLQRNETAANWSYASAAWRPFNNTTLNRVEVVLGLNENPVELTLNCGAYNNIGATCYVGIAIDTTATPAFVIGIGGGGIPFLQNASFKVLHNPGIGYHYYQAMEYGNASGDTKFYGSNIASPSGLIGQIIC